MTTKATTTLSQEEKRVKIAEACGWTVHHGGKYVCVPGIENLTDPFRDLNACHIAWLGLSPDQKRAFEQFLQRVMLENFGADDWLVCATAHFRAEAIGRTLKLWQ